jgi:hypothetical protein
MRVRLAATGEANAPCAAQVDGRWIAMRDFPAFARQWRGREAHLDAAIDTPYRCIGEAIYQLQLAGFGRIGFISEPAPAPDEQQQ